MVNVSKVADRLKEIRAELKLSQEKFGKILSVSQDTVSLWETGKSLPSVETVIDLCEKFSISADYVLGLED